jgi:elongation factor P
VRTREERRGMATTYFMNDLRVGLKIMMDDAPCVVTVTDFVKPGKGQAFVRLKYKNLKTGRVNERTLKAAETVGGADVVDKEMQYLYADGEHWYFMDQASYEQLAADAAAMGDSMQWIKEEDLCVVTLWEGAPIVVTPPNFVVLEVVETDPGLRGDTSSGGSKPATFETGAVVRVPLFVQIGDRIRVDTRTGEYVSRA